MSRVTPLSPIFQKKITYGTVDVGTVPSGIYVPAPVYSTLEWVGRVTDATRLNGPVGLVASGNLIVVAMGASATDRVTIIDASTPSSPSIVGSDADNNFNGPASVDLIDATHAIVTCGANLGRVSTVDFTDPGAAVLFDGTDSDSTNFFTDGLGVAVIGTSAFITGIGKFGTMDVSSPAAPNFTNVVTDATAFARATGRRPVCVIDNSHVIVGATGQLTIVDVSNPNSPSIAGSYVNATNIGLGGQAVDVVDALCAHLDNGSEDLILVDISTIASPSLLGVLDLSPYSLPRDLRIIGNYVVVVCLLEILLVDITDRTSPVVIDTYPDDGFTQNTEYLCRLGTDMVAVSGNTDDTITILQLTP